MAMMMDIPNVAATPSNAPVAKKGAVKGQEESFQGTLNEETLKQAQETAEKPQPEQTDPSLSTEQTESALPGAVLLTEPAAAETNEEPIVSAGEEEPQDGKENLAVAVSPAPLNEPAISSGESISEPLKRTDNEAPANNRSGNAPAIAETESEKSGADLPEQAASIAKPATTSSKAPEQVAVPGNSSQAGSNASHSESKANALHGNAPPVSAAASEIVRQQTTVQQPVEGLTDQSSPKAAQSGLLEASFAGILQSPGTKGQSTVIKPLRASNGTSEIAVKVGEAESLPVAKLVVTEEKGRNFSEAMLEKGVNLPDALETGKGQTPGQSGSVFESTLVSTASGNHGQGQTGPLQNVAPANTPLPSASFNEEVRILDQVMTKLSFNRTGGNERIIIKLYPEELGEVKLDLTRDKDQLKVHLFAQTQQVQEILEKHLPRLQEALNNQGIQFDDIKVSVDSQRSQGREFQDRNHQPGSFARPGQKGTPHQAGLALAANASRSSQGGISLRI